jgi:hypothetical protein
MLADDWFIPLIKSYASMSLSQEQLILFASDDPMKWDNVEGELRFQMLKLEQYIAKLRKAIDKIYAASKVSGAAAVAATIRLFPVTPNDVLSLFICAQTVDTLKKIIKKLVAADCPPIYSALHPWFL